MMHGDQIDSEEEDHLGRFGAPRLYQGEIIQDPYRQDRQLVTISQRTTITTSIVLL